MLTDLPNVSIVLAEELSSVGISTPKRLVEIGAKQAWDRLRAARLHADARALLALEGAITGLPWQSVPAARRLELLRHAMGNDVSSGSGNLARGV